MWLANTTPCIKDSISTCIKDNIKHNLNHSHMQRIVSVHFLLKNIFQLFYYPRTITACVRNYCLANHLPRANFIFQQTLSTCIKHNINI